MPSGMPSGDHPMRSGAGDMRSQLQMDIEQGD